VVHVQRELFDGMPEVDLLYNTYSLRFSLTTTLIDPERPACYFVLYLSSQKFHQYHRNFPLRLAPQYIFMVFRLKNQLLSCFTVSKIVTFENITFEDS